RAMLRAWGDLVHGASQVWRQLPRRSDLPGTGTDVIDQLERAATTLHRAVAGSIRPGAQAEPVVADIGQAFTQAADLITASGVAQRRESNRWTGAELRDAFAA